MKRSDSTPAGAGPGRRWGAVVLLGGALLAGLWALAPRGPATFRDLDGAAGAAGAREPAASESGDADRSRGGGSGTAAGWRAPFRSGAAAAGPVAAREPEDPAPWLAQIRTNGVFDPQRVSAEPGYLESVERHLRLRALVRSPARETPECRALVELARRRGLSLAAVPELYNALWEVRAMERRLQRTDQAVRQDAMQTLGLLELEDFMSRFRRNHRVEPGPVFEELMGLGLHPTVFFGNPDVVTKPGEPLLAD